MVNTGALGREGEQAASARRESHEGEVRSQVRPATADDIPELVRLRGLLFHDLAAGWGSPSAAGDWRGRSADDLAAQLATGTMRISVTDGSTGLACCGMGVIDQRLPSPYNPGGRVGHVFGIVTDPAYRRRGHARAIMRDLLDWFDERGLERVDLNASPEGQRLYRTLGFTDHPDPTLSRKRRSRGTEPPAPRDR